VAYEVNLLVVTNSLPEKLKIFIKAFSARGLQTNDIQLRSYTMVPRVHAVWGGCMTDKVFDGKI
jgi:hypothetical protein